MQTGQDTIGWKNLWPMVLLQQRDESARVVATKGRELYLTSEKNRRNDPETGLQNAGPHCPLLYANTCPLDLLQAFATYMTHVNTVWSVMPKPN